MLIKINESDPEFIAFVDELKQHYSEATAAGASKKAIINHVSVAKDLKKTKKKLERLEDNYQELIKLIRDKASIEQSIRIMTG
jgi:hypothetical protein